MQLLLFHLLVQRWAPLLPSSYCPVFFLPSNTILTRAISVPCLSTRRSLRGLPTVISVASFSSSRSPVCSVWYTWLFPPSGNTLLPWPSCCFCCLLAPRQSLTSSPPPVFSLKSWCFWRLCPQPFFILHSPFPGQLHLLPVNDLKLAMSIHLNNNQSIFDYLNHPPNVLSS